MTELLTGPPPPDAIAAMAAIPGLAIAPGVLVTQEGPAGTLGPEGAGAVLLLQATFADVDHAAGFWAAAVPLMALLHDAPGFIRRFSFMDGPSINLIALWRSVDDARTFQCSSAHRSAVEGLYRERWQYTHFSALWELSSSHDRIAFCDRCDAVTPIRERSCRGCGAALIDPYAVSA
jgi:hypothetical protein